MIKLDTGDYVFHRKSSSYLVLLYNRVWREAVLVFIVLFSCSFSGQIYFVHPASQSMSSPLFPNFVLLTNCLYALPFLFLLFCQQKLLWQKLTCKVESFVCLIMAIDILPSNASEITPTPHYTHTHIKIPTPPPSHSFLPTKFLIRGLPCVPLTHWHQEWHPPHWSTLYKILWD